MTWRAVLMLAASWGVPARADVPPAIPTYHYYGPVRACQGDGPSAFAIDVAAGEGVTIGNGMALWQPGRAVLIGQTSGYAGGEWDDIRTVMSPADVPGVGRFERISLGSRSGGARTIRYLRVVSGAATIEVASERFDGGERDLATLRRVSFGEAAVAACADVPAALAATPARYDADAFWLDPRRHVGPMTLCVGGVAFDLAAGETATLPWLGDRPLLRVTSGTSGVGFEVQRSHSVPTGKGGLLIDDPALTLVPGWDYNGGAPALGKPGAVHLRLMLRTDTVPGHRATAPVASWSFDAGTPDDVQRGFARRVRVQRPSDRCYTPPA